MDQPTILPRPRQITIAIWLIVAECVLFLAGAVFRQNWHDPWSYVTTPLVAAFAVVWIYPILRRKGWVRWVLAALTLLLCANTGGMRKPEFNWQDVDALMLSGFLLKRILAFAEVLLLFSAPATTWFRHEHRDTSLKQDESV